MTKDDLRKSAAAVRAEAYAAQPMASLILSAWAPRALVAQSGLVVSGYRPFRSEIDPRPLMQRFARAGATITLPVTPAKGSGQPLRFYPWRAEQGLTTSAYGVQEPPTGEDDLTPDVVLTPLLAFDRQGGRMGYGAGHYDRTLEQLRANKPIIAIGLAFSAQEVKAVPIEAHDQRLDAILTERGFIAISPCASAGRVC